MRKKRADTGIFKIHMTFCDLYRMYYVNQWSCEDIAAFYECSSSTVNDRIKHYGMKVRAPNDTKRGNDRHVSWKKNIDLNEAVSLYMKPYWSVKKVAEHYGVSNGVISLLFSKNGIKKKHITELRNYSMENHPLWDHSKTDEERQNARGNPLNYLWRDYIFARDSYTCQKCGDDKGGNLNAHHIEPYWKYKDKRHDMDNGVTLCVTCHKAFHKKYGIREFGILEFEEFMK